MSCTHFSEHCHKRISVVLAVICFCFTKCHFVSEEYINNNHCWLFTLVVSNFAHMVYNEWQSSLWISCGHLKRYLCVCVCVCVCVLVRAHLIGLKLAGISWQTVDITYYCSIQSTFEFDDSCETVKLTHKTHCMSSTNTHTHTHADSICVNSLWAL